MDERRWPAQEPPDDFTDRVMGALDREPVPLRRRARTTLVPATMAVLSLAAAAALFVQMSNRTEGDIRADSRQEVTLGDRVTAVLEPGAHLAWKGSGATQDRGDVFYRVERGGPLTVHTPAGDVTVHGTCFRIRMNEAEGAMNGRDVKSAAVGAAAVTALATVLVYEGKVSLSHAGQRPDETLTAGQSATLGGTNEQMDKPDLRVSSSSSAGSAGDPAYEEANRNLAASVHEYQAKLAQITAQKADVETRLQTAQQKLARANGGDGAPNDPYDLGPNDWKELAKRGAVRYRLPCSTPNWTPSPEKLSALGLSPDDGRILSDAVKRSNTRTWSVVGPLCAQALGGNSELADTLGPDVCTQVINGTAKDPKSIMETVGRIRAGEASEPAATDSVPPSERMFLAFTAEPKLYEADLAKSLGPEEAHRLSSADTGCLNQTSFGPSEDVMR